MPEHVIDVDGPPLWEHLECCSGITSTWVAPVGSAHEHRVLTFTSHDLWCTAGQAALDGRSTL